MDVLQLYLADLVIKLLVALLIMQSLGFFWFVYVVIRFGLLRRDEPEDFNKERTIWIDTRKS